MGPLLVLVSPCFRETVVVTCILFCFVLFCSLDNLLQKKLFFSLFLEIIFENGAHLKKGAIFDLLFTFFSHQGKVTKPLSAHISLTYMSCILLTLLTIDNFEKKKEKRNTNLSGIVSLWCDSWC